MVATRPEQLGGNDRGREHPERALALSYASHGGRVGLVALFGLDETLGQILRTTREPIVGQMRLTWWHDALAALDMAPAPAQPVLQALEANVLPHGVTGAALAGMIDGWEALLDPEPLDAARMAEYAAGRGGVFFTQAGILLGAGPGDPVGAAGRAWALADLARHLKDEVAVDQAVTLAEEAAEAATAVRWTRAGRSLGALAHIARMDLAVPLGQPIRYGSPMRVARLAWHRMGGR